MQYSLKLNIKVLRLVHYSKEAESKAANATEVSDAKVETAVQAKDSETFKDQALIAE